MSDLKVQTPIEDFDWNAYASGETAGAMSREELMKTYDESLNTVKENEVAIGRVKAISKRDVRVDIGMKSDAIIPISEFRYNPDLKEGDEVEVFVETLEDKNGQLRLSHKKACQTRSWDRVNKALENDEVIKGYVKSRTKGGMIVDVFGIEAFLPGSQIDVRPIRDYDVFVDKTMEFKVVKINQEYKNVVVSHKALIEAELEAQKREIISKLEKGQVLEGKNITAYGVFVDLGGVDGLVHITDLSWGRVSDPREVVELDQDIKVVIIDFDDEKKRIALGLKQLQPHPWDSLSQEIKVGDHINGRVVVMTDYGAFVEIEEGVDGLIHISDLSWTKKIKHPSEFTQVGNDIEVQVLEIDKDNRRLSLGHKQLEENPWDVFETIFTVGSIHEGTVIEVMDKGAVIALEYGVEGFATPKHLVKEDGSQAKLDDKLNFKVIEFNKDSKRIILSHSRIAEDANRAEARAAKAAKRGPRRERSEESAPAAPQQIEKTTLGDLGALQALKEQMQKEENKG